VHLEQRQITEVHVRNLLTSQSHAIAAFSRVSERGFLVRVHLSDKRLDALARHLHLGDLRVSQRPSGGVVQDEHKRLVHSPFTIIQ